MKSKKGVNLKSIHIGEVVLIKEYKDQESFSVATHLPIDSRQDSIVTKSRIRKVVFIKGTEAKILSAKLKGNSDLTYKIMHSGKEKEVKHNTLLVDKAQPVGDFLAMLGYPMVVSKRQLRNITKSLLSFEKEMKVLKHKVKLTSKDLYDENQIKRANNQAIDVNFFKSRNLPIEEQEMEKVYAKHFKK